MRKRISAGGPTQAATDAAALSEKHLEVAREIGALQRQARATNPDKRRALLKEIRARQREARTLDDAITRAKRAAPRKRARLPERTLFQGGRKEASELEDSDDTFTAADLMRSRRVMEDQYAYIERYKVGEKKGQPKFDSYKGGLKERNEALLKPHTGQQITLKIRYRKLADGGLKTTSHVKRRKFDYRGDYGALVHAYTDSMREAINEDSELAYYVQSVEFDAPEPRQPKRKKSTAKRRRCRARTKDGKRCKRHAIPRGRYCWQHSERKG